jgi:hypothetical protein
MFKNYWFSMLKETFERNSHITKPGTHAHDVAGCSAPLRCAPVLAALYAMRSRAIQILKITYLISAILSLILCVLIFRGDFDVGHGGVPIIVLFVNVPALVIFTGVLATSLYKLKRHNESLAVYYALVTLNIIINLVSCYALFSI